MTKQGYIEFRRGAAAFKNGTGFRLSNSHEWKIGYLNAEQAKRRESDAWKNKPEDSVMFGDFSRAP